MGLLSILLLGGGVFFADQEKHRFERKAATDILGKMIDGKGHVEVKVDPSLLGGVTGELHSATITGSDFGLTELPLFTEPDRGTKGKIESLKLRLSDFTLKRLKIARLEADIPGCRYDFDFAKKEGQIRLSRSGIGDGWVQIRQGDLAEYLVKKFHEIKSCTVKLDGNKVWVEGYGEFLIIKTKFEVIADLAIVDGDKLELRNAEVYFDWMKADDLSAQGLLKTLNPVVDLRKDMGLYDAVFMERLKLRNGLLTAWGKTKIPVRPADESLFASRK
jgi:hypothetical protein